MARYQGEQIFTLDLMGQEEDHTVIARIHLEPVSEPRLPGGIQGHGKGTVHPSSPEGMKDQLISRGCARARSHELQEQMVPVRKFALRPLFL